jgi:hypothetical protein
MRPSYWVSRVGALAVVGTLAACSQSAPTSPSGGAVPAGAASASSAAAAVAHSVTGSGEVSYFGISFRNSIAAQSDANGNAWGEVSVPLNLTSEGVGRVTFSGKVNCLEVDGKNAWVGFLITRSTNGDVVPPGLTAIALVRDLGGPGQDITDGEFFPPDVRCTDRPTGFLETVVLNGNYTVR